MGPDHRSWQQRLSADMRFLRLGRFYRRAYVEDRGWLDTWRFWIDSKKRGEEVRQQMNEGGLSLCPFFWSVIVAAIFYNAWRVIRTLGAAPAKLLKFVLHTVTDIFFNRISSSARVGVVFVISASALFFITATNPVKLATTVVETATRIPQDVSEWNTARIEKDRARELDDAKWEVRLAENRSKAAIEKAKHEVWRIENPTLAAEQDARRQMMATIIFFKKAEKFFLELGKDFLNAFMGVGILVLCVAIPILSLYAIFWIFSKISNLHVQLPNPPLWREAKELLRGFLRAKKEKACPLLTFPPEITDTTRKT